MQTIITSLVNRHSFISVHTTSPAPAAPRQRPNVEPREKRGFPSSAIKRCERSWQLSSASL